MADVTTAVPARTELQRLVALKGANEIRTYRKDLKREMRSGRGRTAADVLLRPRWQENSWKVFDLLLAMPAVGQVKANKVLTKARISPAKTVGGLSDRQRHELVGLVSTGRARFVVARAMWRERLPVSVIAEATGLLPDEVRLLVGEIPALPSTQDREVTA